VKLALIYSIALPVYEFSMPAVPFRAHLIRTSANKGSGGLLRNIAFSSRWIAGQGA